MDSRFNGRKPVSFQRDRRAVAKGVAIDGYLIRDIATLHTQKGEEIVSSPAYRNSTGDQSMLD